MNGSVKQAFGGATAAQVAAQLAGKNGAAAAKQRTEARGFGDVFHGAPRNAAPARPSAPTAPLAPPAQTTLQAAALRTAPAALSPQPAANVPVSVSTPEIGAGGANAEASASTSTTLTLESTATARIPTAEQHGAMPHSAIIERMRQAFAREPSPVDAPHDEAGTSAPVTPGLTQRSDTTQAERRADPIGTVLADLDEKLRGITRKTREDAAAEPRQAVQPAGRETVGKPATAAGIRQTASNVVVKAEAQVAQTHAPTSAHHAQTTAAVEATPAVGQRRPDGEQSDPVRPQPLHGARISVREMPGAGNTSESSRSVPDAREAAVVRREMAGEERPAVQRVFQEPATRPVEHTASANSGAVGDRKVERESALSIASNSTLRPQPPSPGDLPHRSAERAETSPETLLPQSKADAAAPAEQSAGVLERASVADVAYASRPVSPRDALRALLTQLERKGAEVETTATPLKSRSDDTTAHAEPAVNAPAMPARNRAADAETPHKLANAPIETQEPVIPQAGVRPLSGADVFDIAGIDPDLLRAALALEQPVASRPGPAAADAAREPRQRDNATSAHQAQRLGDPMPFGRRATDRAPEIQAAAPDTDTLDLLSQAEPETDVRAPLGRDEAHAGDTRPDKQADVFATAAAIPMQPLEVVRQSDGEKHSPAPTNARLGFVENADTRRGMVLERAMEKAAAGGADTAQPAVTLAKDAAPTQPSPAAASPAPPSRPVVTDAPARAPATHQSDPSPRASSAGPAAMSSEQGIAPADAASDRTQALSSRADADFQPLAASQRNATPETRIVPGVSVESAQAMPAPASTGVQVPLTDLASTFAAEPSWKSFAASHAGFHALGGQNALRHASTLRIELKPVELGAVTAELKLVGDQLSVAISVDTQEAYQRLSQDKDSIVQSLRGLGLQIDQVTVQQPQAAQRSDQGSTSFNAAPRDPGSSASGQSGSGQGQQGTRNQHTGNGDESFGPASQSRRSADAGNGLYI